jgi:hypothetical protein
LTDYARTIIASDDDIEARAALGLGTLAIQNKVNDGDWFGTDLAVANGGTGASDAAGARTNLELNPYASGSPANLTFPVGTCLLAIWGGTPSRNAAVSVYLHANGEQFTLDVVGSSLTGTWHCRGHHSGAVLVQRVA